MPSRSNPPSPSTSRSEPRARRWALGALIVLGALLLVIVLTVHYRTGAPAMERRLRAALGVRGDSLYRIQVATSHLSILAGTYVATGIEIIPDSAEFQRREDTGQRVRDRFLMRARSFRVTGLGVLGLLRNRLEASTALVDSLYIEVHLDRRTPDPADSNRRLPHEFFRTIGKPVRLDTFRIENSEVRYYETAFDGARPGMIRFANTRIGVYNLTNDSLRMDRPVILELQTLLAGSAPTSAVFEYDFRQPKLNLNYQGSIGDLDAERLNGMTVNLEGLRLAAGHLDTAWFKFRVKDGVADGQMQLRYRHLHAEVVDKVSRKGGITNWLKSFVANAFIVRGHNRADEDHQLRTALIQGYTRLPSDPLFKFVWHTLREGLFVTVQGRSALTSPGTKEIKRKRP